MISILKIVAKTREVYHLTVLELVKIANQLRLLNDDKAEEYHIKHFRKLIIDIWPSIYNEDLIKKVYNEFGIIVKDV